MYDFDVEEAQRHVDMPVLTIAKKAAKAPKAPKAAKKKLEKPAFHLPLWHTCSRTGVTQSEATETRLTSV